MGKLIHYSLSFAPISKLHTYSAVVCICSAQPTTTDQAKSTYCLGSYTVSATDGVSMTQDFYGTGGYMITVNAHTNIPVVATGTATHIAIVNTFSDIIAVTTCTALAVSTGEMINTPAWTITVVPPT